MSQPVDTQACLSSGEVETGNSDLTQFTLTAGGDSANDSATPSTSTRKREAEDSQETVLSPSSQLLFDSPLDHQGSDIKCSSIIADQDSLQDSNSQLFPPKKRARVSLESQSQEPKPHSSLDSPKQVKIKVLPNGKTIQYVTCMKGYVYYNAQGAVVHSELEEEQSQNSAHSSGYLGDIGSSSGTSSGRSAASQENMLKAHRSYDDNNFLSPAVPKLRETNSAPPQTAPKPSELPRLPKPKNVNSVIVSQQRHHILSSATNGKVGRLDENIVPDDRDTLSLDKNEMLDSEDLAANADTEPFPEDSQPPRVIPPRAAPVGRKPITRRKRRTKSLWPSEYPYRSARNLPPPHSNELAAGAKVLAKWPSDGHYYFGRVAQKAPGVDRWHVVFDDNTALILPQKDLLVTKSIPKHHPVYARRDGEDEYHPSVIKDLDDGYYMVSYVDSESPTEYKVSSADICLDANQFSNLKISLLSQLSSSDEADKSRKSYQKPDLVEHQLPSKRSLLSKEKMTKWSQLFCDVEKSPVKSTNRKPATAAASDAACCSLSFGSSATTTSDVYGGMVFMCTHLCKSSKQLERVMDKIELPEGDDESASQAEYGEEGDIDGDTICAQIEALGGMVIDAFDADTVHAAKKIFLISTGFHRTVKYLQCLAANIAPVSYQWVRHCYRIKQFVSEKDYLLPAGIDISGKVVEWKTRAENQPLKDISVYIAEIPNEQSFSSNWKSILTIAGAIVLPKISINSGVAPHYILARQGDLPTSLVTRARRLQVPLVTPEFIIQRLITGCRLDPGFHPTFQILP